MIEVYFDGLCQPVNPGGVACYGFVVYKNGDRVYDESDIACKPFSKEATNNLAEYTGCLKALCYLDKSELTGQEIVVRGDSQLVIQQLNGAYKVKAANLIGIYGQIKVMSMKFKSLKFEWVEREKNKEADTLCNIAYKKFSNS